jgi:hypothetical protein
MPDPPLAVRSGIFLVDRVSLNGWLVHSRLGVDTFLRT